MKILVTGAAGFIGYHLTHQLLSNGHEVVGLDNINGYYDVKLKFSRLQQLGISQIDATPFNIICTGKQFGPRFKFIRMHLEDREKLPKLFRKQDFDVVCNLAAQAGVRFSIENPEPYIDSNVVGFLNLLECCRNFKIKHLIYASSSSVYGLNDKIPFSIKQNVDQPISLYAATKKTNELLAHSYSHLYNIPTTGLRFFTVYGAWGRPDMALFLFTEAMAENKPIKVFNEGKMERDFTFIDDIIDGVLKVIEKGITHRTKKDLYRIYNLGNGTPVALIDFIKTIAKHLNVKPQMQLLPLQQGDMKKTWADVSELKKEYDYQPNTSIEKGIKNFVDWYLSYHKK